MKNKKCPVCNKLTFDKNDFEYAICEQCFWEYDSYQVDKPNYKCGANVLSLNEYKKVYSRVISEKPNFSCKNKNDLDFFLRATKQK